MSSREGCLTTDVCTTALPKPSLPNVSRQRPETPPQQEPPLPSARATPTPSNVQSQSNGQSQPRSSRKQSFGYPDADPWGSPANNKINGSSNDAITPVSGRTTSAFSSTAAGDDSSSRASIPPSQPGGGGGGASDWTPYGSSTSGYSTSGLGGSTFGGSADEDGDDLVARPPYKPSGRTRLVSHGAEEEVAVTALPEKEGVFLFQYRNYELTTARRNSKVVRRYSDFVWLLDCLHKKYPFRQLPLLPPKRVASKFN